MLQLTWFNFSKPWLKRASNEMCLSARPGAPLPSRLQREPSIPPAGSPECLPERWHHVVSLHEEGNLSTLTPRRQHDGEHIPAASQVSGTASHLQQVQMSTWVCPQFLPHLLALLMHVPHSSSPANDLQPFRAISGASWGWVSVHQPPQNSICPGRAEASAWWCLTYKADVLHHVIWCYSDI